MAPPLPQMRATWMKLALSHAKRLPDAERARRAVDPALFEAIKNASVVEWLPAEAFARLAEAFVTALGEQGARTLWRDALLQGFDRPLMRPLIEGALALYGRSPASVMKMSPRAWALVARDAGAVSVHQRDERTYSVSFEGMPPEFRRSPAVMTVLHGNCDAVLRRFGVTGSVREDVTKLASRGDATLTVGWTLGSLPPPPLSRPP